ncbi:YqaJ viral recombinase family protein [Streptomyces sp. NPDC001068]|uniref:YqaJ viral recombinase family nuclease n=1 Tax=Streptomyces sp. NPDC001068 TaxID=3364544 RepID=UPI0036B16720
MTATITELTLPGVDLAPEARVVLPAGDMLDPAYRELWLDERLRGLGGSDVAVLLGFVSGKGPWHVYEDKHGRGKDFDTEAMEFGREMEEPIARVFSRRTGIPVITPPGMYVNVERPWMLGNVDRLALDPDTGEVDGPVECKNRTEWQLTDWEQDEAPDAPQIQNLWYQGVGGWRKGYVAACVGGNKLRWHAVPRREDLLQHLVQWTGDWWHRHIVEGEEPPADGLPGTKDLLAHLWDVKADAVAEVAVEQARNLRKREAALSAAIDRAQRRLETVQNTMRLIARENEIVKTPGGKVAWTWKQNGNFAGARFAKAHPDLAKKYEVTKTGIDTKRLAAEHPAIYREFRARVLRVPAKEV